MAVRRNTRGPNGANDEQLKRGPMGSVQRPGRSTRMPEAVPSSVSRGVMGRQTGRSVPTGRSYARRGQFLTPLPPKKDETQRGFGRQGQANVGQSRAKQDERTLTSAYAERARVMSKYDVQSVMQAEAQQARETLVAALTLSGQMAPDPATGYTPDQFVYNEVPLGFENVYAEEWRTNPETGEEYLAGYYIPSEIAPMSFAEGVMNKRGQAIAEGAAITDEDSKLRQQVIDSLAGSDYLGPDEKYLTETQALQQLYMADVDQLAEIKNNLIALDLLDADKAGAFGFRDINSSVEKAFTYLVGAAQQNDMRWDAFMDQRVADGTSFDGSGSRGRGGGGGGGGGGATLRLSSPDTLRTIANQVAQQKIGRRLDDESLNRFVQAYQDMERQFQQAYTSGAAEITEAPAADVAAEQQIGQMFKTEDDLYAMGSTLDMFTQIVGGAG